jgi:Flp pilus assembly protein TadG
MTKFGTLFKNLRRNSDGATLLEFAFVAPVFVLMLMGAMDVGYSMYIRTVASGTLERAARNGSLEGANFSQVEENIRTAVFEILPTYARFEENVDVSVKNYTDFSRIAAAEKFTKDINSNGVADSGDCWIDEDNDGQFGVNQGQDGIGGADDAVYYNTTIRMKSLFPFYEMISGTEDKEFVVKTLVINQPFQTQNSRLPACMP